MNPAKIQIDIISDVVCPWCVIGYGRLNQALATFGDQLETKVVWHPFELNPTMPMEGENLRSHLAKKYGTTPEGSVQARKMLTEAGAEIGFSFDFFDDMTILNTRQCHQLLHWARDTGLQQALANALFEHYFGKRGTFTETELLAIVEQVGLDVAQAASILANNTYQDDIELIEQHWHQQGISGVPLFVFNGQHALSGAQQPDVFERLIKQLVDNH